MMLLLHNAQWLIDILNKAFHDRFTGSLQINFFQGGISNVTRTESFKPKE